MDCKLGPTDGGEALQLGGIDGHHSCTQSVSVMSYSVDMFGRMFTGQQRHVAYMEALRQSIKPGDVVIDIGTGIGVYAMQAARLGARKVYAIEPNPLVRLGPSLAQANGFSDDHIEFYETFSTEFDPPELADVIFADLRGRTPLYAANVPALYDAATRLLKPGGILIPQVDSIYASLVCSSEARMSMWSQWNDNPFGFDLAAALELQFASIQSVAVCPADLLTARELVAQINYGTDPTVDVQHTWRSVVAADGVAAGLASWFDGVLIPGVTVSNGPEVEPSVYGGAFLGFAKPFDVRAGETVELSLRAVYRADEYTWSWSAGVVDGNGVASNLLRGSTLMNTPMTKRSLALLSDDRTLTPSRRIEADALMLSLLVNGATVGNVSDRLFTDYPDVFSRRLEAKDAVVSTANSYARLGRV